MVRAKDNKHATANLGQLFFDWASIATVHFPAQFNWAEIWPNLLKWIPIREDGDKFSYRSINLHALSTAWFEWETGISLGFWFQLHLNFQPRSVRLSVSCAAKPETVEKVCKIVKKQLVLPIDSNLTGESKFSALGADSLDTVEILMGVEEEFGFSVNEDSAQTIATVQEAADLN